MGINTYDELPAIYWYTTKQKTPVFDSYQVQWLKGTQYVGFLDQPEDYICVRYQLEFFTYTQTLSIKGAKTS